jgi:RNA recognition motif-containing protein
MRIYVGGLPWSVTDQELESMFTQHGEVTSANVAKDKFTNQSRGFGFVDMPNDEQAKAAIAALNGKEMNGRSVTVNEARPQGEGGGGGRRGPGGGGGGRGGPRGGGGGGRGGYGGGGGGGGGNRGGGGGGGRRY